MTSPSHQIAIRLLALFAIAWTGGAALASTDAAPELPGGFDCASAAESLGYPGAKVEQCRELFPAFYRVVLSGAGFPAGHQEVVAFVWEGDRRSTATGYGALSAYLTRTRLLDRPSLNAWSFSVLLDALSAMPPGFVGADLTATVGDLAGGLTAKPFSATLIRPDYRAPAPQNPDDPPTPPGGVTRPRGATPGATAPAPASPIGRVPMPGGLIGRATLTATEDYRFTWTVDTRQSPRQPWVRVSTERF